MLNFRTARNVDVTIDSRMTVRVFPDTEKQQRALEPFYRGDAGAWLND